jgi:ABC-2 type transport system permease protein
MQSSYLLIAVLILVALRIGWRLTKQVRKTSNVTARPLRPLTPWQRKLYTVWVMFVTNFRRVFRDRTALFFTFMFPLIFLFIFGGIFGKSQSVTFRVAIIDHSTSQYARQFVGQAESSNQKILKVDKTVTTMTAANEKMSRGEIDATIELPATFGAVAPGKSFPAGEAVVHYTQNNAQAAETLTTVLQAEFQSINTRLVKNPTPFTVSAVQTNTRSLSTFDYTFTGLLGFAILGMGIFGPMNVFPELKKMGILRRLHTTPLRVWQYFLATMMGQAVVGLLSLALMFGIAILVFHLKVVGNYLELGLFLVFGIVMILGIGLSLGGWAKNERQVAPLANIITFPMMFLSGTFFPRYLMPHWLQNITTFMPLTPIIDGARMIATEGKNFVDLGPQLGIMAVWTLLVYVIAFRVFRWE